MLVVDDNRIARQTLRHILESLKLEVVVAGTGKEGLQLLEACTKKGDDFDLVLMDWKMPLMDGIETAKQIKNNLNFTRVPIVIMNLLGPIIDITGRMTFLSEASEIRTRLMTIYIVFMFTGGGAISWASTAAYDWKGWIGNAALATALSAIVVALTAFALRWRDRD